MLPNLIFLFNLLDVIPQMHSCIGARDTQDTLWVVCDTFLQLMFDVDSLETLGLYKADVCVILIFCP